MVFPLSAKAGSLLGWAQTQGLWEPPSLWMLVSLLAECLDDAAGDDELADLDISWFNPEVKDVIQSRPDGCATCRPRLVEALTAFRFEPKRAVLKEVLDWQGCECRERVARSLASGPEDRRYLDRLQDVAVRWEATDPIGPESIRLADMPRVQLTSAAAAGSADDEPVVP
jgi:hypothetical protein